MLFWLAQYCKRVSRLHLITDICYQMQKYVTDQVPWEWEGGRGNSHMETPLGPPDTRKSCQIEAR